MTTNQDETLLVIGAGCGRTGTASLKSALEMIYHRPCYHMLELMEHHRDHSKKWVELDREISSGQPVNAELVRKMLHGYACAVDFPACSYYWELMQVYPNAKVILTVRDSQSWIESVRETILPRRSESIWFVQLLLGFLRLFQSEPLWSCMMRRAFGPHFDQFDDAMLARAFERWNEEVKRRVPADRLLVFRVQQGWEPLCQFLRVPVPDQPFPRVNDREQFISRMKQSSRPGRVLLTGFGLVSLFVLSGVSLAYLYRRRV